MVIVRVLGRLLVLVGVARFYAGMARHVHFTCPRCGASFKVANLPLMVTIHLGLASFLGVPEMRIPRDHAADPRPGRSRSRNWA